MIRGLVVVLLLVASVPSPVAAETRLRAGFSATVYLSGTGFDASQGANGIPSTSTLAIDPAGVIYLARTGRRYSGGEVEDVWPIYRIPLGGARLTPDIERRYFYSPPLPNAQIAALRSPGEVLVTTFDRERKLGVLYRVVDGQADLIAGGTPPKGTPPVLMQPEGATVDTEGNLYVADRSRNVVVKLDRSGKMLDPRYVAVPRPRTLAMDARDHLWIGSDGNAEAPWARGEGEIWRVTPQGQSTVLLRGTVSSGVSLDAHGRLFVADRAAATIFAVTSEGKRVEFATFTDGDAPRALAFAPDTPATRQAGIAGQLFVVRIARGAWSVNEVIRISGPFDQLFEGR